MSASLLGHVYILSLVLFVCIFIEINDVDVVVHIMVVFAFQRAFELWTFSIFLYACLCIRHQNRNKFYIASYFLFPFFSLLFWSISLLVYTISTSARDASQCRVSISRFKFGLLIFLDIGFYVKRITYICTYIDVLPMHWGLKSMNYTSLFAC